MVDPVRHVGPYELLNELGRGGMGVVFEARHPGLPRTVALKRLATAGLDPELLVRFQREAEVLARVSHPNVVRVHSFGRAPEGPYLVCELVEGESLEGVFKRGPLPAGRAAALLEALADAVEALHRQGVLHRDLKPGNVMLRPDGSPVLLDFGLARDLDAASLTATGQTLGTPAYMAPEQADPQGRTVDERTDVYGLGALLFALVNGSPPFVAESPLALLNAVLTGEPTWAAAGVWPAPLEAIARRALARTPADRYPSAAALRDDLARWRRGEQVLAGGQTVDRTRALWVGGGLLVATLVGALWAARGPREPAGKSVAAPPDPALATDAPRAEAGAQPYAGATRLERGPLLRRPSADLHVMNRVTYVGPGRLLETSPATAKVRFWTLDDRSTPRTLTIEGLTEIWSVATTPAGVLLGGLEDLLVLVDPGGAVIRRVRLPAMPQPGCFGLAVLSDGTVLVGRAGGVVHHLDLANGAVIATRALHGPAASVSAIAAAPGSQRFASAPDVPTTAPRARGLRNMHLRVGTLAEGTAALPLARGTLCVSWTAQGTLILGGRDLRIRVLEPDRPASARQLVVDEPPVEFQFSIGDGLVSHSGPVRVLCPAPGERLLSLGSTVDSPGPETGEVRLWDLREFVLLDEAQLQAGEAPVDIALSPTGDELAVALRGGGIVLFRLEGPSTD